MLTNRSVSTNIVLPHVVYRDVDAAVQWLSKVFGFQEHYRYGTDPTSDAQVHLGDAWIMVRRERGEGRTPSQIGSWTQSLTVFVEDVEAHYENAKAAGI